MGKRCVGRFQAEREVERLTDRSSPRPPVQAPPEPEDGLMALEAKGARRGETPGGAVCARDRMQYYPSEPALDHLRLRSPEVYRRSGVREAPPSKRPRPPGRGRHCMPGLQYFLDIDQRGTMPECDLALQHRRTGGSVGGRHGSLKERLSMGLAR
jgi:hypothetical protein